VLKRQSLQETPSGNSNGLTADVKKLHVKVELTNIKAGSIGRAWLDGRENAAPCN
jgi:hypothetical protein